MSWWQVIQEFAPAYWLPLGSSALDDLLAMHCRKKIATPDNKLTTRSIFRWRMGIPGYLIQSNNAKTVIYNIVQFILSNRAKIADLNSILYDEYYYYTSRGFFLVLFNSTQEFFRA